MSSFFTNGTEDDVAVYLLGPAYKSGRSRSLDVLSRLYLIELRKSMKSLHTSEITSLFVEEYLENITEAPSESTVYRTFIRAGLSRKVMERKHYAIDYELRLDYLYRVESMYPDYLVDIDETASSPAMFVEKYGWSEVGEKCYRTQFVIHNKHYSTIAAYSPRGFIALEIFEGAVGAAEFIHFLNNSVRPKLLPHHFCIIDNCAIHKTEEAIECLEELFNGLKNIFCNV